MKQHRSGILVKELLKGKEHLAPVCRILREHGFNCDAYKTSYLQRRIQTRLRANELQSYRDYCKLLRVDPKEFKKLLDALTINVTGFFRDFDVYKAFQEQVIADLLNSNKSRKIIRIWSAGCASGEEPYSIAMLMLEALGCNHSGHIISIYATDIDERSLEIAREGHYTPKQLEHVPEDLIEKYFIFNENYEVKNSLRSLIKFKRLDLLTDKGIKLCDIVFCRNVLIYFNREEQERTLEMFYKNLKPRGYLILGKTEIMSPGITSKFLSLDTEKHIYLKESS